TMSAIKTNVGRMMHSSKPTAAAQPVLPKHSVCLILQHLPFLAIGSPCAKPQRSSWTSPASELTPPRLASGRNQPKPCFFPFTPHLTDGELNSVVYFTPRRYKP
ncbi:MAG: hypothetical protein NTY65_04615, partial [Planctomycetota bacterium]|nr:hypothetical protein [Planctomycetota bacterium]